MSLRDQLEKLTDDELLEVITDDPSEYRAWIAFNTLTQRNPSYIRDHARTKARKHSSDAGDF